GSGRSADQRPELAAPAGDSARIFPVHRSAGLRGAENLAVQRGAATARAGRRVALQAGGGARLPLRESGSGGRGGGAPVGDAELAGVVHGVGQASRPVFLECEGQGGTGREACPTWGRFWLSRRGPFCSA